MKRQWFIITVLFPVVIFSQENSTRLHLHTIVTVGMAAGESTVKPLAQLEAGVFHDRIFTGLGFGLDQYNFKSIPLFVDARMHFGKARSVFVYGNGGYNFPYSNRSDDSNFFKTTDRFYGGFYMDAGIGYRILVNPSHRLLFSAGYSQKNIVNKIGYTYPCLAPPCDEMIYNYHYKLGRIVTKLSWEFGK
jgi:hypothetical protein